MPDYINNIKLLNEIFYKEYEKVHQNLTLSKEFIYSPYTNKWYNSRKELNKDMRRLKLMKIFKNEI